MSGHVGLGELDSYGEDADREHNAGELESYGVQSVAVAAAPTSWVKDVCTVWASSESAHGVRLGQISRLTYYDSEEEGPACFTDVKLNDCDQRRDNG